MGYENGNGKLCGRWKGATRVGTLSEAVEEIFNGIVRGGLLWRFCWVSLIPLMKVPNFRSRRSKFPDLVKSLSIHPHAPMTLPTPEIKVAEPISRFSAKGTASYDF